MIGIASRSELSREELQRMADAGVTAIDCMRQLNELGSSVVLEILKMALDLLKRSTIRQMT